MRLLSFTIALLFLFSCKNKDGKPDISKIDASIEIHRFDKDFFAIDTNNVAASLNQLNKKYPSFLPLYFEYLSPINTIVHDKGQTYAQTVIEYYRNMKPLEDDADRKFKDLGKIKADLEKGLRYVKFYYPSFKTPQVFTSVESLNPEEKSEIYGTAFFHDTLIISLQMFMGKDYAAYDPTFYFDYIRRRFEPEFIVPNSIRAVASTIYPDSSDEASLIEQMIEKGKQWYMLDHFLPDTPDSLKTFFTQKQLDWCKTNEGNIWNSVMRNAPDVYTLDKEIVQTYIGEAPFTQNIESENLTPGNVGQWFGWQIVKKFAEKNSSLKLQQVLATPAKQIFQEAKYKPK